MIGRPQRSTLFPFTTLFRSSVTVSNVETITGGAAADTVVLATQATGGTIDLGGGSDTLTLSVAANTLSVGKIGRASGRERGKISVVAVTLKKKRWKMRGGRRGT